MGKCPICNGTGIESIPINDAETEYYRLKCKNCFGSGKFPVVLHLLTGKVEEVSEERWREVARCH